MLRVLNLLAGNLSQGPSTLPFPSQVPTPGDFRGLVRLDPSRCLTCGICAYVCVSRAITGLEQGSAYLWSYDPGRCTFCARCRERCPGRALSMDPAPMPPYARQGDLYTEIAVERPACPECGKPAHAPTEAWLQTAFGQVDDRTRRLVRLCVRCRRRQLQRGMKAGAVEVV